VTLFRRHRSTLHTLEEARRLYREGREDEHLALLARAVTESPANPDVAIEYATSVAATDPERSRAEVLRAVALDQTDDPVRLTRAAMLLLDLKDYPAARSCAGRARGTQPANPAIVNELSRIEGVLAALDGDNQRAEELLRSAHEADSAHDVSARDLAWFLVSRGRHQEALAVVDRTLATAKLHGRHHDKARLILEQRREKIQDELRAAHRATGSGGPVRTSSTTSSTSSASTFPRRTEPDAPPRPSRPEA